MSRSTILTRILGASLVGMLLGGCLALPRVEQAMVLELRARKGTLPLKAGLMTLTDARPAGERQSLRDIEDFPGRVTLELQMDLSEAQLFSSIGQDSRGADVILRGEIRSFEWKPRYAWAPYIPGFGFLAAVGAPFAYSTGRVELAIDIVDAKTDQRITSYSKAASDSHSFWVYRYQDFTAGSDRQASGAFRRVVDELQTAILMDGDRIVAAVKR